METIKIIIPVAIEIAFIIGTIIMVKVAYSILSKKVKCGNSATIRNQHDLIGRRRRK